MSAAYVTDPQPPAARRERNFLRVFADLADRVALSPDDTFVWLQAVAKEWSRRMN